MVQFFISTKATMITDKVNTWLTELEDDIEIDDILPFMSFAGKEGYMIGCMVKYHLIDKEENDG